MKITSWVNSLSWDNVAYTRAVLIEDDNGKEFTIQLPEPISSTCDASDVDIEPKLVEGDVTEEDYIEVPSDEDEYDEED